jgi:hypothetical protein
VGSQLPATLGAGHRFVLLLGLDRLELFTEPVTGLKRTILVAFPASFAATAFDSLGGKSMS